jgi:hypothetical protein
MVSGDVTPLQYEGVQGRGCKDPCILELYTRCG